jgi:hypothetical protein
MFNSRCTTYTTSQVILKTSFVPHTSFFKAMERQQQRVESLTAPRSVVHKHLHDVIIKCTPSFIYVIYSTFTHFHKVQCKTHALLVASHPTKNCPVNPVNRLSQVRKIHKLAFERLARSPGLKVYITYISYNMILHQLPLIINVL